MPASTAHATREQARAARHNRQATLLQHAGKHLAAAAKVHWKTASFDTFPEALAELASGITVSLHCHNSDGTRGRDHHLRFHPDGSVTAPDHDEPLTPEAVATLGALGASLPTCLVAASILPGRQPHPAWAPGSKVVIQKLRTLHTAVQWAQVPGHTWTPDFGDTHLREGITLTALDAWTRRGWTRPAALRFMSAWARPAVADAWREAGVLTVAAARLAGQGALPETQQEWSRLGFTPSTAESWRRLTDLSPAEAHRWHTAGFSPTLAAGYRRALTSRTLPLTEEDLFAWRAAGLPARDLNAWHTATGGDLDAARRWHAAGATAHSVTGFTATTQTTLRLTPQGQVVPQTTPHPYPPLGPEAAAAWIAAGIPGAHAAQIRKAAAQGVTPEGYAQAIASLSGSLPPFDLIAAVTDALAERARRTAARAR